ncbi:MAG: cell division protein FtsZ, partial [Pseudonocardiales bacterium]|nr:cell division protein FtsZ [Pseudonocardiales bacterium]
SDAAHPDANIIFGAVIDDTLGDEVKVTVIAAGFDSGQLPYKKVEVRKPEVEAEPARSTRPAAPTYPPSTYTSAPPARPSQPVSGQPVSSWPLPTSGNGRTPIDLDEELDVPDFLKN